MENQITNNIPIMNRIFLNETSFFRHIRTKDSWISVRDPITFPMIIEALISHSAGEIYISGVHATIGFNNLPDIFKNHIKLIDKKGKIAKLAQELFMPLYDEFDITTDGVGTITYKKLPGREEYFSLVSIYMYDFILGLKYNLQVDLKLNEMLNIVDGLLQVSRDRNSRAILSTIRGLFNYYELQSIYSIAPNFSTEKELVENFNILLDDVEYQLLSKENYLLGIPSKIVRAKKDIKRITRKIVSNKKFRACYKLSSIAIQASTKIPPPTFESLQQFSQDEYLPPLINIQSIIDQVRTKYYSSKEGKVIKNESEIPEHLKKEIDEIERRKKILK
jgi:hypothetical protein